MDNRKQKKNITISELTESFQNVSNDLAERTKELGMLALRYEMALEAAPNAMIMVNQAGEIILVNRQTERLFGYGREELVGHSVDMLVPESTRPEHPELFASFFLDPKARAMGANRDLTGQRKDGSQVSIEIGLNPIMTDEGILVMASIVDITERKRAEKIIEEKQRDLIKSNEDLEQFAYLASHDLRAPLRSIASLGQWIGSDLEPLLNAGNVPVHLDTETRLTIKDNLSSLVVRTNRMNALLNDLLTYSKVGRIHHEVESINFIEFVRGIVELQDLSEDFHVDVVESPVHIVVEKPPLDIVLRNLISNSVKHSVASGGRIEIRLKEQDERYLFSVLDDGPGIPEKYHQQVFEMFQTLKSRDQVEGSGMGLAVVKKIIEFYGGDVSIRSDDNVGGTEVSFTWKKVS